MSRISDIDELIRKTQILEVAHNNGGIVSYRVLVDLLKDDNPKVPADTVQKVMERLHEDQISVVMEEDDEEYADHSTTDPNVFIPSDVNITPRMTTISLLIERLAHGEIDMAPYFQRRGGLWSEVQQSQLIESLMLKIPLPAFYFDATDENNWVVIDGLQRLTALKNFAVEKKMKLKGLEFLTEFNDCSFDELPRQYSRRINETQIMIYTVEKGTPDDIVFNIFRRINTGGLALSPQEIRHALYHGAATELIDRMVQNPEFLKVSGGSISADRMMDREYATRFVAFTELDYQREYNGNIDSFLIKALKRLNNQTDQSEFDRIYEHFNLIMHYSYIIFGSYAFRKVTREHRRGPINKAIFEVWSICLGRLSVQQLKNLVKKREKLQEKFIDLLMDSDFSTEIKAGDRNSVERRVTRVNDLVKELLND